MNIVWSLIRQIVEYFIDWNTISKNIQSNRDNITTAKKIKNMLERIDAICEICIENKRNKFV